MAYSVLSASWVNIILGSNCLKLIYLFMFGAALGINDKDRRSSQCEILENIGAVLIHASKGCSCWSCHMVFIFCYIFSHTEWALDLFDIGLRASRLDRYPSS
jgi:hypothetical protein